MSSPGVHYNPHCYIPPAGSDVSQIISDLQKLSSLIDMFGMHNVAGCIANEFMNACATELKNRIMDSNLPDFMKDAAIDYINDMMGESQQPVSPGCEEAMQDSPVCQQCAEAGHEAAAEADPSSESGGSSAASEDDLATDAALFNSRMDNESRRGSASASSSGGKGNWLLELAKGLAEVQDKFLTKALSSLETMKANADSMNGEGSGGDKGAFLTAQAEYQASMQMFNMMANMTSTTLKTLGEGLTAIARKQ